MGKFKSITAESYFEPNLPPRLLTSDGDVVRPINFTDYLRQLEVIELGDKVPEDVGELFEVAKGAYAYGSLYWPLFTVANHYAVLAVEAAFYQTYRELGGDKLDATMGVTVAFIEKTLPLPESILSVFPAMRGLRNELSHPKFATITGPTPYILQRCAEVINALTESNLDQGEPHSTEPTSA